MIWSQFSESSNSVLNVKLPLLRDSFASLELVSSELLTIGEMYLFISFQEVLSKRRRRC